jgi:hypothetical protein
VDGGWANIRAFGLAVAITWDKQKAFRRCYEADALALITELEQFAQVITYNGKLTLPFMACANSRSILMNCCTSS